MGLKPSTIFLKHRKNSELFRKGLKIQTSFRPSSLLNEVNGRPSFFRKYKAPQVRNNLLVISQKKSFIHRASRKSRACRQRWRARRDSFTGYLNLVPYDLFIGQWNKVRKIENQLIYKSHKYFNNIFVVVNTYRHIYKTHMDLLKAFWLVILHIVRANGWPRQRA